MLWIEIIFILPEFLKNDSKLNYLKIVLFKFKRNLFFMYNTQIFMFKFGAIVAFDVGICNT